MKLLGVSAGAAGGSAEILLKAALMEGEALGHEASWLCLDDLHIASGPMFGEVDDDSPWFWEQVMAAEGIIYSAPIYSRMIPGKLRLIADRVFGPHSDVGFIELLMERERAGEPIPVPFRPDERALRDRVVAFIAVGGALTSQWNALALPEMHSLAFSMRDGIVDQMCVSGAGTPASVVLDPAALERARRLGRNVAEQLGRSYDEVEYRGEPGLCPLCHLNMIDVRGDAVECASCGAAGRLEVDGTGVRVVFPPEGLEKSVISMTEKRTHALEILDTAARHAARSEEITAGAAPFSEWQHRIAPGPRAVRA